MVTRKANNANTAATRRGPRGGGTVFQRTDGRWCGRLTLPSGKAKYVYATTQRAALAKLREVQQAVGNGLPLGSERTTVGEYLESWLEQSARPRLRPRIFEQYRAICHRQLIPALGHFRLVRLGPEQVQQYVNARTAAGRAPNTVRNEFAVLRRALTVAERWQLVPRNVCRLVSPPRVPREEVHPLSVQQARILLVSLGSDRLAPIFHLTLALGLRQGEALGLTWDAVDLQTASIRIERGLQRYGGAYHLDEVKTSRSRRTLALPGPIVDILRTQRTRQREDRLKAGAEWTGNEWNLVFTTPVGAPVDPIAVRRTLKRALGRAGLPPQRFHDLRHAAASFMLAQGVPLKVAQEVLGHSTIAITADTYSHLAPTATRDAIERVGALLWDAS